MTPTICATVNTKVSNDYPDYINIITTVGVIGGVVWGMRQRFSFGKTLIYALVLGVSANYVSTTIFNQLNQE